ncbi:Bug family tripartite tricarboxylate transporter substrate binding protein [Falsiroseomonas sp.]|uniref:Bug family tripartite tricarboxylate transporter substrate binding protein n=1 Tax=Falsiroseomonas sp. TaxID=2870721 RepID=UPI003F6E75E1
MIRRRSLLALPALAAAPAVAQPGWQPDRPLRWILGYPPGGGSDLIARLLAQAMAGALGQPVVVENRPGGGGVLGAELAARAAPDGHTLLSGDNGILVFHPFLHDRLPYDPARDFRAIGGLARFQLLVLVPAESPLRDLAALRGRRGLSYGSSGVGSPQHLAAARLLRQAGAEEATHIPYRGGAAVLTDLMAGRLDLAMLDTAAALPQLREGKLRALAIGSATRLPALPDVPTAQEAGLDGYVVEAWQGLVVPAATPQPAVDRLAATLTAALAEPTVQARLAAGGIGAMTSGPAEFDAMLAAERATWGPLIRALGVRLAG